jgi:predicted RNA-binding Zn-ribbon protein involved in translation (DUF1610 family)
MSERLTKYNHVIISEGKKIEFKCATCGTLNVIAPSNLTRDIKSEYYICCDPMPVDPEIINGLKVIIQIKAKLGLECPKGHRFYKRRKEVEEGRGCVWPECVSEKMVAKCPMKNEAVKNKVKATRLKQREEREQQLVESGKTSEQVHLERFGHVYVGIKKMDIARAKNAHVVIFECGSCGHQNMIQQSRLQRYVMDSSCLHCLPLTNEMVGKYKLITRREGTKYVGLQCDDGHRFWIREKEVIEDNRGCPNPLCSDKLRRDTCMGKYGYEVACQAPEVRKKIKETLQTNYGVDNPFKSAEIREKAKTTMVTRYGKEHSMQVKEIIDKTKQTNLERYGKEYVIEVPQIQEKIKLTNIKRYGSEYALQNPIIREKAAQTWKKNYDRYHEEDGDQIAFQDKARQTNLERHGDEYPMRLPEFQDKIRQTNLERHGDEYPIRLPKFQDKARQTNLERYGDEYPMRLPEFQEKIRQTNLERHGDEYPMRLPEFQDKQRQTMMDKYGENNAMKVTEFQEKVRQTNLERYGDEYPVRTEPIKDKINQTNMTRYGYNHTGAVPKIREKMAQTNIERRGVDNPWKLEEIQEKCKETKLEKYGTTIMHGYKQRDYIFPSGRIVKIQGYEDQCLDLLLNEYEEDVITVGRSIPFIRYTRPCGKKSIYHPDIMVPDKLIEVKSWYTYDREREINDAKFEACVKKGYVLELWIFSEKKDLTRYKYTFENGEVCIENLTPDAPYDARRDR